MPSKKKKPRKGNPPVYTNEELCKKFNHKEIDELCSRIKSRMEATKNKTSSESNDIDNPVTVDGNEGKNEEDINLPHSSCSGSIASRASGQIAAQKSDCIKKTSNINLPNPSSKKPSSLCTVDHQVDEKNVNRKMGKKAKNGRIPEKQKSPIKPKLTVLKQTKSIRSSKNASSLCTVDHQEDEKNDNAEARKKAKNDRNPQKEKSPIKPNLPVPKHTKSITESKELSSNTNEARPSCSQSDPVNYSDDKNFQKCNLPLAQIKSENKATAKVETVKTMKTVEFVSNTLKSVRPKVHRETEDLTKEKEKLQQKLKTYEIEEEFLNRQEVKVLSSVKGKITGLNGNIEVQIKSENKATAKVETVKPMKSVEFVSNILKNVRPNIHRQTEDLTKEKEKLQQKLKTCEIEEKFLNRQEGKVLSSVKGKSTGVSGNIEVYETDKSVKNRDKEGSITYDYRKNLRKVFIEDESLKFFIQVSKGYHIVCESRKRSVTDLVAKSSSGTLERPTIKMPEGDMKSDSENYGETTSDSNIINEFSSENFQTVYEQTRDVPGTNTLTGPEQYKETTNDAATSASSSIVEFFKGSDNSRLTSVKENLQRALQQKPKTYERQEEFLNGQKEKLLSSGKGKSNGISGNIEVQTTDKSVQNINKKDSIKCRYKRGFRKSFMGDKFIKMCTQVNKIYHAIFNSRTLPVTDLVDDIKSSSGTRKGILYRHARRRYQS